MTREEFIKQAEEELYTALKALQDGDLPFARSSAGRAQSRIVEAHQAGRRAGMLDDGTTVIEAAAPRVRSVDSLIKDLTLTD